jgi:uncharacterized protein (TIGR02646 family)
MIQLKAQPKPSQLTISEIRKLTKEFIKTDKSVWKKEYIVKPLLVMSFNKCCFCETKINQESKYMEVEHFYPKSIYKFKVVSWKNLLPICGRCNKQKSDHDTKKEPIIHPVCDNPKQHLKLQNYRLEGITELGKKTVSVVKINDNAKKLPYVRFCIGNAICFELEKLLKESNSFVKYPSIENKNDITEHLTKIMLEGTKEYAYSATAATVILTDSNYQEIKQLFIDNGLWDDEFKKLEQEVGYCALI